MPKGEQDYDPTPCKESTFEKGDLMFKLVKTQDKEMSITKEELLKFESEQGDEKKVIIWVK